MQEDLTEFLRTDVQLQANTKGKGKLVIPFSSETIKRRMTMLQTGGLFRKHGRLGMPHVRFVWCSKDLNYLYYRKLGAKRPKATISTCNIVAIHKGYSTKVFK